jgi:hypothetical protein
VTSAAPSYEGSEVRRWVRDFPVLAARVRIPVHYSLGDHEKVWRSGPAALAYHLKVLSFAEECVLTRGRSVG